MQSLMLLAAEATEAVKPATDAAGVEVGWKAVLFALIGAGILRAVQWLIDFMTAGGQKKLLEVLAEALRKSNNTSVGSQIKADDAMVKILEDAIPVVMSTLSETIRQDMEDGKLDKDTWSRIHKVTWEKVKPQVAGGLNDYLKHSSWDDGMVVAKLVWDRWIAKKKTEAKP